MRFMIMVKSAESASPPPMALMAAIAKLGEEATRAGAMVEMGGLLPNNLDDPLDYPPTLRGSFDLAWEFPNVQPPEYLNHAIYELQAVFASNAAGWTLLRRVANQATQPPDSPPF